MTFDADYFETNYRDYERQNPARKLDWYLTLATPWLSATEIRHLDIGCGPGAFVAHTSRIPRFATFGTDISADAITAARKRAPEATLAVAGADARPWPPDSFHFGSALDVLEHVPDPAGALDALASMLTSDGVLLAVMPVYDGASGPVIRMLDRDPTHIHKWPRGRWLELIESRFEILDWRGAFRLLIPGGFYLHLPTRRLRSHSPAIAVLGRRRR